MIIQLEYQTTNRLLLDGLRIKFQAQHKRRMLRRQQNTTTNSNCMCNICCNFFCICYMHNVHIHVVRQSAKPIMSWKFPCEWNVCQWYVSHKPHTRDVGTSYCDVRRNSMISQESSTSTFNYGKALSSQQFIPTFLLPHNSFLFSWMVWNFSGFMAPGFM